MAEGDPLVIHARKIWREVFFRQRPHQTAESRLEGSFYKKM